MVGLVYAALREKPAGLGSAFRRAAVWYSELALGSLCSSRELTTRCRHLGGSSELEDAVLQSAALSESDEPSSTSLYFMLQEPTNWYP